MKRLVSWVNNNTLVSVKEEELLRILFHRGRMLLLDSVAIFKGKAVGEFLVRPENCEGHEPMPGTLVFRGVDMVEMAFQLLGVIVTKNPVLAKLAEGKTFVAREIEGAKFCRPVLPRDSLTLETIAEVQVDEALGLLKIESMPIIGRVNGQKVCSISSVAVAGFISSSLPR